MSASSPSGSAPDRRPPYSPEAEEHVLACVLMEGDNGATLQRCKDAKITPASFYGPYTRRLYEACLRLWDKGVAPTLDTLRVSEMDTPEKAEQLGGWGWLMQVTGRIPTTAHAGYFIEKLREKELLRDFIRASTQNVEDAYSFTGDLDEFMAMAKTRIGAVVPAAQPVTVAKPLFTLASQPDNDPSILLGNRYLSRGDGAVLSSSSGMGKSAMAIQLSTLWALGRPAFGIRPHLTMRILYVQSEDSEGDMAEVTESMRHGLKLTDGDLGILNSNLLVITDRVNRGPRFLASLKHHIAAHKPDLVILNPLQAFLDGDITESRDLGKFLREGLNALNEPASFAYLLIHHTTKPATGKERSERLWHEVMYDMAGGAEIINWARAIMSLRATANEGEFNLVLAKRGKRAGVTKEVEQGAGVRLETVTTLALKHSTNALPSGVPMIFWETRTTPDAELQKPKTGGRPPSHHFDDYAKLFPAKSEKGLPLNQLHARLNQQRPISKDALFRALKRWASDGDVEIVAVAGQNDLYRRVV